MIKPYSNYSIDIRNLYTYREFLKKRPKIVQQFRFSTLQKQSESIRADKRIQLKLLKLLKITKPIAKVDLKECVITNYDCWKAKFLAVCKRISHVKTFFMMSAKSRFKIKCFKHFLKLKHLLYNLDNDYLLLNKSSKIKKEKYLRTQDYLEFLKYCPKIRSVDFADLGRDGYSPKIIFHSNRYLKSLESLALRIEKSTQDQFKFPIESCKNLRSISFQFQNFKIMEKLPNLPDLQEIDVSLKSNSTIDFLKVFKKITQKGILKKVKLEFDDAQEKGILNLQKAVFKLLKYCKLTHFSLKADMEVGFLNSVSQFIQGMSSLESLELYILNEDVFSEDDNFVSICKNISQLQALRALRLHFQTSGDFCKDERISNFLSDLSPAFLKPIKIKTFQIGCNQIDPPKALQNLMSLLENSADFLTHVRMDFGELPCTPKTYQLLLELLKKLSNIQVLEIPCLDVSGSTIKSLNEMTKVLYALKYLRVFEIGEIKGTVTSAAFYQAIEAIASKRGLIKFCCSTSENFQLNLDNERWDLDNKASFSYPNMNKIIGKNPSLEIIEGMNYLPDDEEWMKDLYQI